MFERCFSAGKETKVFIFILLDTRKLANVVFDKMLKLIKKNKKSIKSLKKETLNSNTTESKTKQVSKTMFLLNRIKNR